MKYLRIPLLLLEVVCTAIVLSAGVIKLLGRHLRRSRGRAGGSPRLLVLSTLYTLSEMRARRSEHIVTWRDLDGYFDHVWNVHPLVGAARNAPLSDGAGPLRFTELNSRHTMVEGKTSQSNALAAFPYLSFAVSQAKLVLVLDKIVSSQKVGIIRGDPYYCGLLALILGRLNKRPVEIRIVENGDAIYKAVGDLAHRRLFRRRWIEQRVVRFTLSRADMVVVGNDDHTQFALNNGAKVERLINTGNISMINPLHFQRRNSREGLDDEFQFGDRPLVASISRLERVKHPEDVIISFATARLRNRDLFGMMVGVGRMREELDALCSKLGVERDFLMVGERDQAWIASMLARCNVVVFPLAGLALVESSLSETPVVAYDYEAHSEIIQNGYNGILVPYRDTNAMADAICEIVADPPFGRLLGTRGRARVLSVMDPKALLMRERALAERHFAAHDIAQA